MYGIFVDDRELAAACARGDRVAWEEFLGRYARFIAFAARRLAGDVGADEVVQNTYLALLRDQGGIFRRYDPSYRLTTYLGLIVRGQAERYRRAMKPAAPLAEDPAAAPPPADPAVPLDDALQVLTPRERVLLKLHYEDGLAYKEIGAMLDLPVNTVGSHLLRARNKLKERLGGKAQFRAGSPGDNP